MPSLNEFGGSGHQPIFVYLFIFAGEVIAYKIKFIFCEYSGMERYNYLVIVEWIMYAYYLY